jgi:dinuclear metal center YbgI/SA1388 family protein
MQIKSVIQELERIAPQSLQESYDNSGLLTGSFDWDCTGLLITLDITERTIEEAKKKGCNLVIAHHPIIFKGLKKITPTGNYVERTLIQAIKSDIAIYAIHTNLDNVLHGVNKMIADRLGLSARKVLAPKENLLKKLVFFVPPTHAEIVRNAIFEAGGGRLGNYAECSFYHPGTGTFMPLEGAQPFTGTKNNRSRETEEKVEIQYPVWLENVIIQAMKASHPYEEVAYDLLTVTNSADQYGSGLVGNLIEPLPEIEFLELLKKSFELKVIRHTALSGKKIQKVAVCGGAGSFLTKYALREKADAYITADLKYHEFFDSENRLLLVDIGHWESEQFTIELLFQLLIEKFPTFAVLKSGENTNPVHYFL